MEPIQAFGIAMIILASASPFIIVGIVVYMLMKLRHRQIMTAIEKGIPLANIVRPRELPNGPIWIKYLSLGIGILIASFGFIYDRGGPGPVFAFGVMGFGVCWIVRGYLYRKHNVQGVNESQPPAPIEESIQ